MRWQRPLAVAVLMIGARLLWVRIAHRDPMSHSTASGNAVPSRAGAAESDGRPLASSPSTVASSNAAEEPLTPEATATAVQTTALTPAQAMPVAGTPESSSLPAATVLENMRTTIRQYASAFGENPVGTNPEITSSLQGGNPKHINFLKQDGNRVNAKGELVDVWGIPYFFHQISGHEMEIRSAGADRIMYTADDLVTR